MRITKELHVLDFINRFAHKIHNPNDIIELAVRYGFLAVIKFVDKYYDNVDYNYRNSTGFKESCRRGHYDIVKYFIEHGADIQAGNNVSLRFATINGYYDIVKLLIEHGADIHVNNNTIILEACNQGRYEILQLLLSCADINEILIEDCDLAIRLANVNREQSKYSAENIDKCIELMKDLKRKLI